LESRVELEKTVLIIKKFYSKREGNNCLWKMENKILNEEKRENSEECEREREMNDE